MHMSPPGDTASGFRRGCMQHCVEGETASVGLGRVKLDLGPIFDADESHGASVGGLTSPGQAPGGQPKNAVNVRLPFTSPGPSMMAVHIPVRILHVVSCGLMQREPIPSFSIARQLHRVSEEGLPVGLG